MAISLVQSIGVKRSAAYFVFMVPLTRESISLPSFSFIRDKTTNILQKKENTNVGFHIYLPCFDYFIYNFKKFLLNNVVLNYLQFSRCPQGTAVDCTQ